MVVNVDSLLELHSSTLNDVISMHVAHPFKTKWHKVRKGPHNHNCLIGAGEKHYESQQLWVEQYEDIPKLVETVAAWCYTIEFSVLFSSWMLGTKHWIWWHCALVNRSESFWAGESAIVICMGRHFYDLHTRILFTVNASLSLLRLKQRSRRWRDPPNTWIQWDDVILSRNVHKSSQKPQLYTSQKELLCLFWCEFDVGTW